MDPIEPHLIRMRRMVAVCFFCTSILAACGKSSLPVSIHGVNYSVEPFSFVLNDPVDPKNQGGGELVDSYAAGGTTCCYELPKIWRPGMKVSIQSKHWVGKSADDSLHDINSTHLVDIPQYADGKPGELWVLRAADGGMNIVSSDFQPDHPSWPGKVKGWPIPSLAYQRERWDLYINHARDNVTTYKDLLREIESNPDEAAQDAWNTDTRYDQKALVGFSGPHDPRYRTKMKKECEEGLKRSLAGLERFQKERP